MTTISTGVQPNGRAIYYADGPPTLSSDLGGVPAQAGDMVIYCTATPSISAPYAWVCTTGGTIGTWIQVRGVPSLGFTITNAQLLALNTTPIQILPAYGAGTAIEVVSCMLENVYVTGAFTGGGALGLYYGASATTLASATAAASFLTSPTANQMILLGGALASNLASVVENEPLVFSNASANFAAGGGYIMGRLSYRLHTGLV